MVMVLYRLSPVIIGYFPFILDWKFFLFNLFESSSVQLVLIIPSMESPSPTVFERVDGADVVVPSGNFPVFLLSNPHYNLKTPP